MAERDQLRHHLVVQLARKPAAFCLLGGAEGGDIGMLAAQALLGTSIMEEAGLCQPPTANTAKLQPTVWTLAD